MVAHQRKSQSRQRVKAQNGYGTMPIFRTQPLQRGYGFGGLFRGLLKSIAPIAKRGLLSVGKAALNAGARALEDVRDNNTTVRQALRKQAIDTFHPANVINRTANKRKASSQVTRAKRKVPRTTSLTTTAAAASATRRTAKKKSGTKKQGISDSPKLPRQ